MLLKLANTVLILINTGPGNVKHKIIHSVKSIKKLDGLDITTWMVEFAVFLLLPTHFLCLAIQ